MTASRAFDVRPPTDRPAPWDPVVDRVAVVGLVGLRDVLDQLAALEDET